jgi:hypothetical protein
MSSVAVIEGVAGSAGAVAALVLTYPILTVRSQCPPAWHKLNFIFMVYLRFVDLAFSHVVFPSMNHAWEQVQV